MRKKRIFCKTLAFVTACVSAFSLFSGCENAAQTKDDPNLLDISEYTIVRYEKSGSKVTKKTTALKNAIKEQLGLNLSVNEDWYNPNTPPDPNAKEVLIDKTNRQESQDALAKLEEKEGDAYVVEITENKIVIVGKTELSTMRGIDYFINNYVIPSEKGQNLDISHGKSVTEDYSAVKNIWITDKLDMDVEMSTTVLASSEDYSNVLGHRSCVDRVSFPSIVELQYQKNPSDNGKLIAATFVDEKGRPSSVEPSMGALLESTDGGESWKVIFRPVDTIKPDIWAGSMAHIYELPAKVGKMPAGTLIYSSNTVNYDKYSHISMWISYDAGKTWKQSKNLIATGGGLGEGVWEPVMFYDNGYLYCFYSDDSHPRYDQRIVYKRSKDGVKWEQAVPVCAFNEFSARPGMPVITKMGNGEYFLIYEYCNSYVGDTRGCFVYYKTTKDITNWNPSDPGTLLTAKVNGKDYMTLATPCCVWTPAGGPCGTLFVQGRKEFGIEGTNRMFVSFDYGKTWDTIEPPLPYDWRTSENAGDNGNKVIGYRPIMVLGSDPSVIHYVNVVESDYVKGSKIQYARLRIFD